MNCSKCGKDIPLVGLFSFDGKVTNYEKALRDLERYRVEHDGYKFCPFCGEEIILELRTEITK